MKWQFQEVKQVKHAVHNVVLMMRCLLCHVAYAKHAVKRNARIMYARHVVQNN